MKFVDRLWIRQAQAALVHRRPLRPKPRQFLKAMLQKPGQG